MAKGVIINVTASPDIGLDEIETASSLIAQQADENANIIWGAAFDDTMDDEINVTVIATGFATRESYLPIPPVNKLGSRFSENTKSFSGNSSAEGEDDSVYDIMSIFKNR